MSEPPPSPDYHGTMPYSAVPYDRDQEHLKILSICWYVVAGLAALMGFLPIIHIGMGIFMLTAVPARAGGPPAFMGWIFIAMGAFIMALSWAQAILGFLTARSLAQRRRIGLCYIASAIACLSVPIGTTLGVFTFIVLSRPGVKASFS